eukprot:gene5578-9394_t
MNETNYTSDQEEFWKKYLNEEILGAPTDYLTSTTSLSLDLDDMFVQPTYSPPKQELIVPVEMIKPVETIEKPLKITINPNVQKQKIKKTTKTKPQKKYDLNFDVVHYGSKFDKKKSDSEEPIILNSGAWSRDEHERFLEGYRTLGKRWKHIATHFVKTRNAVQVTSYAQKYTKGNKSNLN